MSCETTTIIFLWYRVAPQYSDEFIIFENGYLIALLFES